MIVIYPGKGLQGSAYLDCAKEPQKRHTCAAFFDANQYLVLKNHETVMEFLRNHFRDGAMSINRVVMSSSGHQAYNPRPVMKQF
jgi:hypothetical protein